MLTLQEVLDCQVAQICANRLSLALGGQTPFAGLWKMPTECCLRW